jgi:hypothetical protein
MAGMSLWIETGGIRQTINVRASINATVRNGLCASF